MNVQVAPPKKREVIIRPYILEDIDFLCDSVEQELPKLPNYKDITVSKKRLEYVLRNNFGNAAYFQCWVLVDTETHQLVGGGAGYCVPGMVTFDLIANDVFLFVFPEWRSLRNVGMLMVAYKDWAKARGAKMIMASVTGGYRTEAFDALMTRQGYQSCGKLWMLRLDDAYLNRT
jgi:hypothetical protein